MNNHTLLRKFDNDNMSKRYNIDDNNDPLTIEHDWTKYRKYWMEFIINKLLWFIYTKFTNE